MKIKLIAAGLIFLGIFVITALFLTNRLKTGRESGAPTPTPIRPASVEPLPSLSLYFQEPAGVVFSFVGQPPVVPDSLPIYKPVFTNHEAKMREIAQALGLNTTPKTIGSGEQILLSWSNQNFALSLTNSRAFSYMAFGNVPTSNLKPDAIIRAFLTQHRLIPAIFNLNLASQTPFEDAGGELEPGLKQTISKYSLLISGKYPLILINNTLAPLTALVDQYGGLRSLSLPFPPDNITVSETKTLISIETALKMLNASEGSLLSISGNPGLSLEPKPNFSRVEINSVGIAYFLLPNTESLVPIYIFSGTGWGDKSSQVVTYILRATN